MLMLHSPYGCRALQELSPYVWSDDVTALRSVTRAKSSSLVAVKSIPR
jgi:hypothetical protein